MDLASRIRMELADGQSPDQVVATLVASGMSEATARRIVDRARGTPAPPALLLEAPTESTGKWEIVQGAFLMSATACMMFLAANTGGEVSKRRYLLGVFGVVLLVRGLSKWSSVQDRIAFPLAWVLVAALSPFGMAAVFLATDLTSQRTAAAPVTDSRGPAQRERQPSELPSDFRARDPETRCRAAEEVARGEKMSYQTELSVMLMWDFDAKAKKCARDAFARLLQSQDELKRLTTIHTLGHEAGGPLFDELLVSAAEHDPSEANRNSARSALERRIQWRKR